MRYFLLINPETGRGFGASGSAAPCYAPAANEVSCTAGQASDPAAWMLQGGTLVAAAPPPLTANNLLAHAAAARFARETGGIEFAGEPIRTDRESQSLIAGAHALALADPDEPVAFKSASGWAQIDSATMVLIGLAVGRHVRDCFQRESEIAAAIATGAITTRAEIDAAFAA